MSKIIVIDAGHGMNTAGKRCLKSLDSNETREWYLNDRIADKVEKELANYDCRVIRADDTTGKNDISLGDRVKTANNANADFYISIHHNAGVNGKSGGGTVVYYSSSSSEREKQATELYNSIVAQTKLIGNRSSKVINYGFYVIKNTKMPALLIENGFMDSSTDVPIILSASHAEKTAKGIVEYLVRTLGLKKKQTTGSTTKTIYRVQCGAYSDKANAEAMVSKLKKYGIDSIIVS